MTRVNVELEPQNLGIFIIYEKLQNPKFLAKNSTRGVPNQETNPPKSPLAGPSPTCARPGLGNYKLGSQGAHRQGRAKTYETYRLLYQASFYLPPGEGGGAGQP